MKKLAIILSLLILTACASSKTNYIPTVISTPTFKPGNPREITMRNMEWKVLENVRMQKLLDDAKKNNQQIVVFALTPKDYENLSQNMAELQRYIKQLQAEVSYYKSMSNK